MGKKIFLAGFACLLLFLVSVARSDPNKQKSPQPVVAVDIAPRPTTVNANRVRKGHEDAPVVKKKFNKSTRQ